jgi:3-hydroxybutyryl-CoA dehydrogenase
MTTDTIQQVLVVGAGAIGRQIAVACAAHGLDVTLFDVNPEALISAEAECRERLFDAVSTHAAFSRGPGVGEIRTSIDAAMAAAGADLLIESVPERLPLKREVFRQFAALCPPKTIFTTNTSVLMPSMLLAATGRPDRFAALHFVMNSAMTEIMPTDRTSPDTIATLEQFSRRIEHLPIRCHREQPGHLVNTMLMSLNNAGLTLVANGVASFEEVDRAWMKSTGSPRGPFGWLDLVGLDTALEIAEYGARATGSSQTKKNCELLRQYVDQGLLGVKSGQGFYTYPGAAFEHPQFLVAE